MEKKQVYKLKKVKKRWVTVVASAAMVSLLGIPTAVSANSVDQASASQDLIVPAEGVRYLLRLKLSKKLI